MRGHREPVRPMEPEAPTPKPATSAERLVEVQSAIQAILLTGQSYQVGSRKLTRADLAALRQLERDLKDEIAAEDQWPGLLRYTGRAVFGRR